MGPRYEYTVARIYRYWGQDIKILEPGHKDSVARICRKSDQNM
jgi:hypothetical protein